MEGFSGCHGDIIRGTCFRYMAERFLGMAAGHLGVGVTGSLFGIPGLGCRILGYECFGICWVSFVDFRIFVCGCEITGHGKDRQLVSRNAVGIWRCGFGICGYGNVAVRLVDWWM